MNITYITDAICKVQRAITCPPEYPDRLNYVEDQLISSGLLPTFNSITPPDVSYKQLARVHSDKHIQQVYACASESRTVTLAPDVSVNNATVAAALKAGGASIQAVNTVMEYDNHMVFCNIRPPGHHACHDYAMGFCVFNNIAIATAHALAKYPINKVAIIDFDVHHGNGTEDIFEGNEQVLYCSSFQHPFYPYTDIDNYADNIVKMPLLEGSTGAMFRESYKTICFPKLEDFKPDLILISAGFDAHILDPLGGLLLTENDYSWISNAIGEYAQRYCHGRVISLLEGGYHPIALGKSVVAHIEAFKACPAT